MIRSGPAPDWIAAVMRGCRSLPFTVSSLIFMPSAFSAAGIMSLLNIWSVAGTKSTHFSQCTVFCWARAGARPVARMPAMPVVARAAALPASLMTLRRLVSAIFPPETAVALNGKIVDVIVCAQGEWVQADCGPISSCPTNLNGPIARRIDMLTTDKLERIEIDAWRDYCAAAPTPFVQAVGLETIDLDGPLLALCRRIDHYQFNRLIGAGLGVDAAGASLEIAARRFAEAGLKNGYLQVAPGPRAAALEDKARAGGLKALERVWVKFSRGAAAASTPPT